MKSLRFVATLGLALGLALGTTQARAAVKTQSSDSNSYINSLNMDGHMGMYYTGSAEVPAVGSGNIALGVNYNSYDSSSVVDIPWCAVDFGVAKGLELSAGLPFRISSPDGGDSVSGLDVLTFGGKYVIPADKNDQLNFAVDLDIRTGAIEKKLDPRHTDVNPKGLVTYKSPDGIVVNGEIGFVITGKRGDWSAPDYIQIKGGVGYAFTPKVTAFGELGINQYREDGSSLALGVRTGSKIKYQGMLGVGLGDHAPDFTLGGSVVFGI